MESSATVRRMQCVALMVALVATATASTVAADDDFAVLSAQLVRALWRNAVAGESCVLT